MDFGMLQVAGLLVVILGILLGLNIWFVKRLVGKIERIPLMEAKLMNLEVEIKQISKDFKDMIHLRERVAVLEYAMKQRRGGRAKNS